MLQEYSNTCQTSCAILLDQQLFLVIHLERMQMLEHENENFIAEALCNEQFGYVKKFFFYSMCTTYLSI